MTILSVIRCLPLLALALVPAAGAQPVESGAVTLRTLLPIPGAAVRRTLPQKLAEQLSVLDAGAACDGLADDTAAINKAIAAGQPVLVPPGLTCKAPGVAPATISASLLEGGGTIVAQGGTAVHTPSVASVAAAAPKLPNINQPGGIAGIAPDGTISAQSVTPAGDTVPQQLGVIAGAAVSAISTVNVKAAPYKAVGDGKTVFSTLTAQAGNQTVQIAGAAFTPGDVGKSIVIDGLGPSGVPLITGIGLVFSPTQVGLSAAPVTAATVGRIYRIDYGTDDSARVQAAHDAAVAAGQRYVFFPRSVGSYFTPTLGGAWNAIFVGDAVLTGTYKKQIVPLSAVSKSWFPSEAQPAQQLTHLNAAMAASTPAAPAIIVVVGTSRATVSSTRTEMTSWHNEVRRRLRAEFPTASFQVIDRGIGGSTTAMLNGVSVAGTTIPYWYTDPTKPWLPTYVEPLNPDAVFALIGVNDTTNLNPVDLRGFVGTIKSWTHPADVILAADNNISMQYSPTQGGEEGFDYAAGLIRSYARKAGLALVDPYRLSLMMREGYDPDGVAMQMGQDFPAGSSVTNPLSSLPITLPRSRDYAIAMRDLIGYNFWQHTPISFAIGPNPGNAIVLDKDAATGNVAITVGLTSTVASVPRFVTAIAAPIGGFYLEVGVRGADAYVIINQTILETPVERFGGMFLPSATFADGGSSGSTISWDEAQAVPLMPTMTDTEMYGIAADVSNSIDPVWGGNGVNHLGNLGVRTILGGALDLTRFAQ